ncbi:ribosome maturation factor RimM [Leifsonia flava]|uniref:ribosome maturation factor RimM n=1 Tax=Orlajensenia leifsoniae TaxID=2561933 RepID=UPI001F02099F|nr:ribosome maturation factor RimM [Leifsonia flava]
MNADAQKRTQLRVGRLLKAHGLKGAIKLELYTDAPERRFVPGAVFSLQVPPGTPWHGKSIELIELRWYNQHPVGFFKDVPDRTAAEALAKAILWVDQDPTELTGEEDAWYDHQLVGLDVVRDGVKVGLVARIDHLPAQDLIIVKTTTGEVMVPFVSAIVPSVDLTTGVVTVTPPLGLFEEIPDDDAPDAAAAPDAVADAAESEAASDTASPDAASPDAAPSEN